MGAPSPAVAFNSVMGRTNVPDGRDGVEAVVVGTSAAGGGGAGRRGGRRRPERRRGHLVRAYGCDVMHHVEQIDDSNSEFGGRPRAQPDAVISSPQSCIGVHLDEMWSMHEMRCDG